jgi:ATP-binding cassette, subfamily C (CFTR/MRP), member 1
LSLFLTQRSATPSITVALLPLAQFYHWIQRNFIPTSRQISRLKSSAQGSTSTHIQSALAGISTIRAFGYEDRFKALLYSEIDKYDRAAYASQVSHRWLSFRLESLGAIVTFLAASLAVITVGKHSGISAAMIGLALVNAQKITNILNIQIQSVVALDSHLTSLEHVVEFTELPSEGQDDESLGDPPASWPDKGEIVFSDYSTRYREDLGDALHHLNIKIKPGERIGIVGRTGAGKTSLTMALYVTLVSSR